MNPWDKRYSFLMNMYAMNKIIRHGGPVEDKTLAYLAQQDFKWRMGHEGVSEES